MTESIFPEAAALEYRDPAVAEEVRDLGTRFKYNYRGRGKDFSLVDGRLQPLTGDDAIRDWIEKILRTDKFKFRIYDRDGREDETSFDFGTEVVF